MADLIANDGSPISAAQAMRELSDFDRARLIKAAGDKVIDIRPLLCARAVCGTVA